MCKPFWSKPLRTLFITKIDKSLKLTLWNCFCNMRIKPRLYFSFSTLQFYLWIILYPNQWRFFEKQGIFSKVSFPWIDNFMSEILLWCYFISLWTSQQFKMVVCFFILETGSQRRNFILMSSFIIFRKSYFSNLLELKYVWERLFDMNNIHIFPERCFRNM